jgi:hypothetical protein
MLRSTLEHLFHRKPFRAFQVVLSTNESFDITHPEAAYLGKDVMAIAQRTVESTDSEQGYMVWIDYNHIVHCQPLQ